MLYALICRKLFSETEDYSFETIQNDLSQMFNLLIDIRSLDFAEFLGHISLEFLSRPDFHSFMLEKLSMFTPEIRIYAEELTPENHLRLLTLFNLSNKNALTTPLISEILFNKQKIEHELATIKEKMPQEMVTNQKRKHPDSAKENKRELKLLKGSFFDKPLPSESNTGEKECDTILTLNQGPTKN